MSTTTPKLARQRNQKHAFTCEFAADKLQEFANSRASVGAVLEQVRVDPAHRRRGYGRVLIAAAIALAPGYDWSTTAVDRTDPVARAFWAAVDWPGQLGTPAYCTDMRLAAGQSPDCPRRQKPVGSLETPPNGSGRSGALSVHMAQF